MKEVLNFLGMACHPKQFVGAIATVLTTVLASTVGGNEAIAQNFNNQLYSSQNVTIDDIVDNPSAYVGRQVTLRSEADRIDSYAFVLDDEDGINLFGIEFDDDELLIFNAPGINPELPDDDDVEVQVTGIVRPFIRAEVERQYGIRLDPNLYAEYEYEPALFAQSVAYAPSPGQVTSEPESFYGRAIAVEGSIDDVYSPYAFSLNDPELFDGEDLLVINASQTNLLQEDANVVVVGELRPFVTTEIERNYNLGVDLGLPGDFEAEYQQRPVLIVREVYPSAE